MGINIRKNKNAIAPLIIVGVLAIIGVSAFTGTYLFFQKPDIVYNITETGFAIFGMDVSWFLVITIIGFIAIIVVWFFLKSKTKATQ